MTEQEMFGERLRRRRMALGLNQQQLAERLGWQGATISRYEKGRYHSTMSFTRLRLLAQVLSTSTDYLLGLTNDPGPIPERREGVHRAKLRSFPSNPYPRKDRS